MIPWPWTVTGIEALLEPAGASARRGRIGLICYARRKLRAPDLTIRGSALKGSTLECTPTHLPRTT